MVRTKVSVVNGRAAVICIVTERILWMIQRGEDGAAVDKCATPQVSALSGTARVKVVGSSPTGGAKNKRTTSVVLLFLCLCPQDTTSFCNSVANIIWPIGQHHSALADTKWCYGKSHKRCFDFVKNDVMLRINDVVLRTNDVASPTMLHFVQIYAIIRLRRWLNGLERKV